MIGFSIRDAAPGDARFLADMAVEAANWDSVRARPRVQVLADPVRQRYHRDWMRPGDLGVVAVDEHGTPIGACWFRLFAPDAAGLGFVAHGVPELILGVVGIWRAQGVGRFLLQAAVERARAAGYQRLSLSVERGNFAQRLYVSEGFATVSSGESAHVMVKTLR